MSFLHQALGAVRARLTPAPPVSAHSAQPQPGRVGASPFRALGPAPGSAEPLTAWDRDPDTGAALPAGPQVSLGPTEWVHARIAHRHGWFATLAHRAAQGDAAAAARAIETMEGWLRQDIPGHGVPWAHPSDLAARLVHWSAGLGWLGDAAPDSLRAGLAGSAVWHLEHLALREPHKPEDGLRRVLHHAGRVIGGFTFPDLEPSRAAWSEGLSGLGDDLPELMFGDGSPRDLAPLALAESLWFAALARAVARANGAGFPADADAALSRGARFLERLCGNVGQLPRIGDRMVDTVLDTPDYPLAWSLWNLLVGWGVEQGEGAPRAKDDPRLAWLGLAPGAEPAAAGGKSWSMWSWREGGVALAEMKIKNKPGRVVATMGTPGRGSPLTHPAPLHLVWDVGDVVILGDPGPTLDHPELSAWLGTAGAHNVLLLDNRPPPPGTVASLDLARVDGKKARIEGHHDGWTRAGIPFTHERKILLNQARCVITDKLVATRTRTGRHAVQLTWQLGPGWELKQEEGAWTATLGKMTLVLQLPEGLSWNVASGRANPDPRGWVGTHPAPCLVGSGGIEGAAVFETSFEIR